MWVYISFWFWFTFHWWLVMWNTFYVYVGLLHVFGKNVHSSPLFFNWIAYIFIADVQEIFFYSGYQSLMKYMIVWFKYMIFSHSVDCISLFWQCPWIYKHFKFWLSPAYLFLLLLPELLVSYPIKHFQIQCHAILFLFFSMNLIV